MSVEAQAVLQSALALDDEERAEIATELIASLDEPGEDDRALVQEHWRQELERRARRVADGESGGEAWDSLRQRLADRLVGG